MRLATIETGSGPFAALSAGPEDLYFEAAALGRLAQLPDALASAISSAEVLLSCGHELIERLVDILVSRRDELTDRGAGHQLARVRVLPPVRRPQKIICIGLNYHDHAEEIGVPAPSSPLFFAKYPNSLIGPGQSLVPPRTTAKVDWEAELAVVIGQPCFDVPESRALEYVAGAAPFNDVTARDLQHANRLWTTGKAIDTFAPFGPALVFKDEIADIQDLSVRTRVNGDLVQDGSTKTMIFSVAELVSFLSQTMTLLPGDIIATGTPAGVGAASKPQRWLQTGDTVEVAIGGLGEIANPIVSARPGPNG